MITLLLICYFLNGLMVSQGIIGFNTKPIMCGIGNRYGHYYMLDDPNILPPECAVIIFHDVTVDSRSNITVDKEVLDKVVATNRPVILVIYQNYDGWTQALRPESSAASAKALTDYVKASGCAGVLFEGTSPSSPPPDTSTAEALAIYITKLKSEPDFYVGITLCQNYPNELADSTALKYEDLNKLVDFYIVNTYRLNEDCKANIFNGATPIIGTKDRNGMDSILTTLKNTSILVDKSYLVEEIFAVQPDDAGDLNVLRCYGDVCNKADDSKTWCAPTTKDYYDKAKFIKDNHYGLYVKYPIYDDSRNDCSCDSDFIGFQNIVAGYSGKAHKPCDKFDRKTPAA